MLRFQKRSRFVRCYLFIHPSVFFRLSRAGSRGQLSEQGHPDFPHPRCFLQLFWEDPKAFPGQLGDIVTPALPGSFSGSPPGGTCQELLPRKASQGHPKQMPATQIKINSVVTLGHTGDANPGFLCAAQPHQPTRSPQISDFFSAV